MALVRVLFVLAALCTFSTICSAQLGGNAYLCVVNCTFRHANAWASVLSLENPSTRLLNWVQGISPPVPPPKTSGNDSLSKVCEVYDSYRNCLNRCPEDFFRSNVVSTLSGIEMICTTRRSDVTSNTMPCVKQFTDEIQKICQHQNEQLLSATNQLQTTDRNTPPINFISLLSRLCESALNQSFCVVPLLQQKCGNDASDLLSQILTASLGSVEKVIGDKKSMMPVTCKELFNAIVKHDNGSATLILPEPATKQTVETTTPMIVLQDGKPISTDNNTANHFRQDKDQPPNSGSTVSARFTIFTFLILFILHNL